MNKSRKFLSATLILFAAFTFFTISCNEEKTQAPQQQSPWGERPTEEALKNAGHIQWATAAEKIGENEYEVKIHAWLEKKWHVYSQTLDREDGPLSTIVTFDKKNLFKTEGKAKEIGSQKHFDPVWGFDIAFFGDELLFSKKVIVLNKDSMILVGNVNFMMCDDKECMPPTDYTFTVDLAKGSGGELIKTGKTDPWVLKQIPVIDKMDLNNPVKDCGTKKSEEKKTYWALFFLGLLGGLISLITPCVFPMIPLTVSFFTKGGKEKGKGIGRAVLYGLSIVAVYAALSLPFYAPGTDPEMLNQISTGAPLNIAFFVIFIVFAISFFGYYEITLPSKWANKADSAADIGGIIGIVFMALVLAIVSFSCTGPLLGSVLAGSLKDGPVPITIAMLGFGVGLGLPFTIFAAFPSLMKSLPQSGGWLNTVKVVLGFVELGLALKFLSNADFVYRAGIVHRETFFLIWTLLAFATAAYLFGLFRFPHDSKNQKIGTGRKVIAIIFLLFGIYTAPGVLPHDKQPWKFSMISGFPPSTWYSWYDQHESLEVVKDYSEAIDRAKAENKAIILDFTGYACVNCRKMEENVWTVDEVHDILNKNYVIASLYVDDKVALPKEKQGNINIPIAGGGTKLKAIKSVGDIWATFESLRFGQVSQPFYVLLHPDGTLLTHPVGYTPNSDEYLEWLKCGVEAFKEHEAALKK